MDLIAISLAARKALEKLGVKIEPGLVLTWDGDTSGGIDTGADVLVKIHDKYLDLSQAVSVSVNSNVLPDFTETTIPREKLEFFAEEGVNGFSCSEPGGMLGAVSIPAGLEESFGVGEGVYVQVSDNLVYISKITLAEIVHPIDPKFLPNTGGGMPVVEITTPTTLGTVPLSDAENAKFNEMAEIGTPFYAKVNLEGSVLTTPVIVVEFEGVVAAFLLSIPREFGLMFTVSRNENGWDLVIEPVT